MAHAAAYGSADGHGHPHEVYDHTHDEDDTGLGEEQILSSIDMENVICLNEAEDGMGKKPFKPYEDRRTDEPFLESDADEQLLLHIPFNEAVSIKSFCFVGHEGGKAPRNIKIWANRQAHDLDFESAEESTPDQELTQLHQDYEANCYYYAKRGKFNTVSSITLFISHNYGAETTRINFIGLKGEKGFGQRRAVHAVYEVAPCPGDAEFDAVQNRSRTGATHTHSHSHGGGHHHSH
eukprot:g4991.t1